MENTISRKQKLTNLLEEAEKTVWWRKDGRRVKTCTYAFVYQNPGSVDWIKSGEEAWGLNHDIRFLIVNMAAFGEDPHLTDRQREILGL